MSNNGKHQLSIIRIEDCQRFDAKKMLSEFNAFSDVQPNNLDTEFAEYLSVAKLEVYPQRFIQAIISRKSMTPSSHSLFNK